jgi:hypothetical protein
MSYQYKALCYGTPESLLSAMAADMSGAGVSSDGAPVSFYTVVDGVTLKTVTSTGFTTIMTPELVDCQLITLPQTIVICTAIISAWTLAYGYRLLRSSMHTGGGDDY